MIRARAVVVFGLAGCNNLLDIHDFSATRDAANDTNDSSDATADAFDVTHCPSGYLDVVGLASRYRYVTQQGTAKDHFTGCADDDPGTTHLVVLSNTAERIGLAELVPNGSFAFIGAIQRSAQTTPIAGWIDLAGAPFDPSAWAANEPNDTNGTEMGLAQFARMARAGGVSDTKGADTHQAICECDGIPIAPEANAILAATP